MSWKRISARGQAVLVIPVKQPAECPRCGQVPGLYRVQDDFKAVEGEYHVGECCRTHLRWWFECICESTCEMPSEWQAEEKWREHVEDFR